MQDIFEAAAFLAEPVRHRNFKVLEKQLVGIHRLAAHLLDFMHRDAAAIEIGIEQAEAVGRAFHLLQRCGARQQQDLFGHLRRRNPDLLAVDDVFVAGAHRARFQLRGVQPGIWFGNGKAGSILARDNRRQHAPALLVGAEHHHRVEPEHIHVHRRSAGHAGPGFGDRPHHDRSIGDAQTGTAIGLGNADAEPAGVGQRLVEVGGIPALLVLLQPVGVVEARADPCHGVADGFLVG